MVRSAKVLEGLLASFATHHICVSRAMKDWLAEHFQVRATVLYDRPPGIFNRGEVSVQERHQLLLKLGFTDSVLFPMSTNIAKRAKSSLICRTEPAATTTIQTAEYRHDQQGEVVLQLRPLPERVGLVMSCTSWTPDEDFTILLSALQVVERHLAEMGKAEGNSCCELGLGFHRLAVVVTGKGPMKAAFEASVAALTEQGLLGRFVAVRTAWLASEDYPALLR